MKPERESLEQLTSAVLDGSVESISPAMQARLRAARLEAVELSKEGVRRPWLRWGWALPAGGLVAATLAAVLATGVWFKTTPVNGIEDVEILAAKQSPDFYQDNAGFYLWLDGQQRAG
jgi:hypothetical protein